MDQLTTMRVFITVARLQSFSKAARQLKISCGTVSRAISELEDRLQTRLLYRTTRAVTLTEDAKRYFGSCVRLLDELDEADRQITRDRIASAGEVRIAVHSMLVPEPLSQLLDQYRAAAPDVRALVTVTDFAVHLIEDRFDIAILPPYLVDQPHVIRRTLRSSRRVFVASPEYLAHAGPIRVAADLASHRLLLGYGLNVGDGRYIEMLEGRRRTTVQTTPLLEGGDLVLRNCAVAGMGVAYVPFDLVATDIASGRLKRVLAYCEIEGGDAELCLFYKDREFMPVRCRTMINLCLNFFRPDVGVPLSLQSAQPDIVVPAAIAEPN
ncbi:LysR family transcriptional regulator [Burkholderia anthina]|uniref:LysR family transcriptional regulator n=1 Tax=Burkholderia anthina TaxID=179879 RepID=UPI000753B45B|nr:LysR family transcriptional regulator [Burkholderia anthina]KVN53121.1 hypothetical protein WT13_32055 [Burkholderia anthina]